MTGMRAGWWSRLTWRLGRMGPEETDAQHRLDDAVPPQTPRTLDEAEALSDAVWQARERDRRSLFGDQPER